MNNRYSELSPSGKAQDFDSCIRGFESRQLSQSHRHSFRVCDFYFSIRLLIKTCIKTHARHFLSERIKMKRIPKIVFTGGPGGGKSHALKRIKPMLEELGITVYTISESAEEIITNGFDRHTSLYEFQKAIALRQLANEEKLEKTAPKRENAVIICDRGLMDCRVYLDDDDFNKIKRELNLSVTDMRDRYDAVFHLNSTSVDSNLDYKTGKVRVESRDEAGEINKRSLFSWCGNPHYRFIPNCESFDEKLSILFREIKAFLGIPKPLEIERKFLIKFPDIDKMMTFPCSKSEITQTYLIGDNGKFRLRKRGENGDYIYIKTVKHKISETIREETETRLTQQEYNELMNTCLKTGSIEKDRYCLMYNGTYYEIDIFPFWKNQAYIEVELLDENERVELPEFIELIREVTYDSRYKNSSLSQSIPPEDSLE